jgi:hypothetical protein
MSQPMSTRKRVLYMALGVLLLPVLVVLVGVGSRLLGMTAADIEQWGDAMITVPLFLAAVALIYLQRRGPKPPR